MDPSPKYGDPDNTLLFKIAEMINSGGGGGGAGVASFNARTGAVTLTSGDVTGALGFTPQAALGFTPENVANKDVDGTLAANSDTFYPSQKAVKTYADAIAAAGAAAYVLKAGDNMTGTLTLDTNKTILNVNGAASFATGVFAISSLGAVAIATNKILLNVDGSASFVGFIQTPFLLDLFPDASTNTAPVVAEFSHSLTAGTAAASFGTSIDITMDSSTTTRQIGARVSTIWTDATHATRTSRMRFFLPNAGTLTEIAQINAVGGISSFQTVGSTPAEGLLIANPTAAANGAQQFSPALRFTGRGWGTAGGTSQACEFRMYVTTVQGVVPAYSLGIDASLNGAAFANRYTFSSAGAFTAAGQITSTTGAIVASTLGFQAGTNGTRWVPQADGIWTALNNGQNDFNRIQLGGTTSSFPSLQRSSALLVARLADDSADTAIRATAFNIGANPLNFAITAYAAGTFYTLTATNAKVDFGTTDPAITVSAAGTYRLSGSVKVQVNGATFAANQTVTVLLRRTNNTAGNITNSGATFTVPIMTTLTQTLAIIRMNDIHYTTANTDDVIEIWADVSALPSAGTISIDAASLTAIRIA